MRQVHGIRSLRSELATVYVSTTLWCTRVGKRCWNEERGQSMVEYAIVVALVAIIAMAAVQAFGQGISQVFTKLMSDIQGMG